VIHDLATVIWKEYREFARGAGKGRLGTLIFVGVFGVLFPLQEGLDWFTGPLPLVYFCLLPATMVMGWVADSFAGERERHTLETLLASRLPDGAILWGKVLALVLYSWAISILGLLSSALAVNIASWDGRVHFYPSYILLGTLSLSLLLAGLTTALGVLISLRAATVRQAAQRLSLGVLVVGWMPFVVLSAFPGAREALARWLNEATREAGSPQGVFIRALPLGLLFLLLVDGTLLAMARARFRRSRLILEKGR